MPNAIEQIYDQITQVLGGTNPNQVLTMLMPGTTLNAQTYAYDTTDAKPAIVQQAESELTDQMFDIAQVSASSNGQKVSSQYLQALSVLVPNFNPLMPVMKDDMRNFLNTPMPADTWLDGAPFTGTFQQYYFRLYDDYIAKKMAWEKMIVDKQNDLDKDPASKSEKYLEWYEQMAEGKLAQIDQALGRVLAVFSPADMDAILGALASGAGGEVYEATNAAKDIQLASPDGGFFYPVELLPNDWFLDLASDLNPVNLLKDPEFIAVSIAAKREALMASISQVQALLSGMPTQGEIKTAAANLQTAQNAYSDAQNNLLNTYADNTATAVEMYLNSKNSSSPPTKDGISGFVEKVSAAKGESPVATEAAKKDGSAFTDADAQALVAGQKTLIAAQSKLLSSSQAAADAGLNLASMQSGYFGDMPVILARMQAQLGEIASMQNDVGNATNASANGTNAIPPLQPMLSSASQATAKAALTAAQGVLDDTTTPATPTLVMTAIKTALGVGSSGETTDTSLQPIYDDVKGLVPSQKNSFALSSRENELHVYEEKTERSTKDKNVALAEHKKDQSVHPAASSSSTKALAVGHVTSAVLVVDDAPPATPTDIVTALAKSVQLHANQPQAKQSATSQRFMELQLSFSNSDMESSSSVDTSSSQSSWSVDLFFGSASGSSSSSSSVTAKNSFDSSTEIKVGMKVAKVDIQRAWLDPGIFKLSKNMSRLSSDTISEGAMPVGSDGSQDWTTAEKMNESLFPAFPVAFIIAKDVNITFKATASSLSAVHSVVDSRSATGGGFLCFSSSSSSASHSDHSSTSVKSKDNVISISMPGPQILGWYLEMTPRDHSSTLNTNTVAPATDADGADINIIQFISQLASLKAQLQG